MFVLLQNVASGMGCLLKPVFYKQIKSINPMVLVIFTKISAFCAICAQWLSSFYAQTIKFVDCEESGRFAMETCPRGGNYTYS